MVTGPDDLYWPRETASGQKCGNRLVGTKGVIEVAIKDGPSVRLRNEKTEGKWQAWSGKGNWRQHITAAILDLVAALQTGREPELSARRALQATELVFATYESSWMRGRVDLPLQAEDSPFLSMLSSGVMSVEE